MKATITKAKRYVAEMFSDESIVNVGLEEVRRDEVDRNGLITVGCSRITETAAAAWTANAMVAGCDLNRPRIEDREAEQVRRELHLDTDDVMLLTDDVDLHHASLSAGRRPINVSHPHESWLGL